MDLTVHFLHIQDHAHTMNISRGWLLKRPLSRPSLTITSCNIEGINSNKEDLLAVMCKETCDVLCIQETHRTSSMRLLRLSKYRNTYYRNGQIYSDLCIQTTKKPVHLKKKKSHNFNAQKINVVPEDFYSHHTSWVYEETDENGHEV